jgi:hypothetical protein
MDLLSILIENIKKWEKERSDSYLILISNIIFHLQIFINDDRFCSYAHRMEPHDVVYNDYKIRNLKLTK